MFIPELFTVFLCFAHLTGDADSDFTLEHQQAPQTPQTIETHLLSLSAPPHLAHAVQEICSGVSYTIETTSPAHVQRMLDLHPELAILQDADRLDALGAVGIGRAFTYGGAKARQGGSLQSTIQHFDEKLLRLPDLMKTEEGRRMASQRVERVLIFRRWFEEEDAGLDMAWEATGSGVGVEREANADANMDIDGDAADVAPQQQQLSTNLQRADSPPRRQRIQLQVINGVGYAGVPRDLVPQHLRAPSPQEEEEEDPGRQLMVEMYGMR